MTREELENNYEYKIAKKALLREFPFVVDVIFRDDEDINKWKYNMYLQIVINPFVLSSAYGYPVWRWVINPLKRGEPYWATYLSMFVDTNHSDDMRKLQAKMEEVLEGIHNSPALPSELKLDKQLMVGSFISYPDTLPPNI
jgi:hypothetical protein